MGMGDKVSGSCVFLYAASDVDKALMGFIKCSASFILSYECFPMFIDIVLEAIYILQRLPYMPESAGRG